MHLTEYEILTLAISVLALLMIPLIGLLIRLVIKWTRTEYRLDTLSDDIKELIAQTRDDRKANNDRLRWLEENLWQVLPVRGKHAIRDKK